MDTIVHKGEMITPANENPYKNSAGAILPSNMLTADNSSTGATGQSVGSQDVRLTVDVNLKGEGVSQLNNMTIAQLTSLVEQTVEALSRKKLSMNTSMARW
jgi:hypothetical protein